MKIRQQPRTFFNCYRFRLRALAATHDMKPDALKSTIDIACIPKLWKQFDSSSATRVKNVFISSATGASG
jgi:hypothetical protein